MGKISLRTYDREIEALVEQGQRIDEAIAHCTHILEVYPKHLETHRLLAKAHLEAKRYEQAVDSFERVLASAPEDFVSHVGLSVIAADSGRLDDAIWHMERAFEAQPSNAAIQGELQRLFGRRDGVEPPKIRLTRGALAHMYMQGELYSQAISEAKAVLLNDSKRSDMQCLLANAYFRNGQHTEAIQVCTELFGPYPYCLEANRLMAEMLMRSRREDLAEQFRQRLNELDPYAAFAKESVLHTADVADSAITLDRLEYSGLEADQGTVGRLGPESESSGIDRDAGAPSWLSGAVPKQSMNAHGSLPTDDIPPFLRRPSRVVDPRLESIETPVEYTQEIESMPGGVPGELPPWIRALAFAEDGAATQGVAAHSDPPDWLRKVGGSQSAAGDPIAAEPETSAIPGSAGTSPREDDDALAWLDNLSANHRGEPDPLLNDLEGLESSDIVSDQERTPSNNDPSGMHFDSFTATGNGGEASVLGADSTASDVAFDWGSGVDAVDDSPGEAMEGENAWTPIMEELDAPDWLVDADPIAEGPSANEDEPAWPGRDPTEIDQSVSDELRESPLKFETIVDHPNRNEGLDVEESVSPPEISSPDEVPLWLRARVEPKPQSTERTRPADWQRLEPDEWSGADSSGTDRDSESFITSEPSASESSTGASAIPQPGSLLAAGTSVPLGPRPKAIEPSLPDEMVVSLRDAQSALGRGNIAAALDIYGKLIRKGKSLEEIIRDLRDALYRYPVEVPIWQALGDAYMRANRLQEALDAYTKAEELLR
jgi:tetratricopeptide (TPR) repeat protein